LESEGQAESYQKMKRFLMTFLFPESHLTKFVSSYLTNELRFYFALKIRVRLNPISFFMRHSDTESLFFFCNELH
ncbi:MAG: hypothetical protein KDA70_14605, partial [Planctomycetaceae bacterium]|nr:hypothetical protein [Planctomycetaceae bacterium]